MKFYQNKFFILTIVIILALFTFQFVSIFKTYSKDTSSYVTLISGSWTLRNPELYEKPQYLKKTIKTKIHPWDTISILSNSLAVIEWWDKSITRLWEKTTIKIDDVFINKDMSKINISFNTLRWKTWSNVVTIMWEDSYFEQNVEWLVAAVRWTVYEVDADNQYIRTLEHEVNVTDENGNNYTIKKWDMFSILRLKIEDLTKLIDSTWEKMNEEMDMKYLQLLRESFAKELENISFSKSLLSEDSKILYMIKKWKNIEDINSEISKLSEDTQKQILNKIETFNQSLNFENWEDSALYKIKLITRQLIIDNSEDTQTKETMIKYSLYDLEELIQSKINKDLIQDSIEFIEENKKHINFDNENFKNFKENFENFIDNLWVTSVTELSDKLNDKINNLSEITSESLKNNLNNLIKNK